VSPEPLPAFFRGQRLRNSHTPSPMIRYFEATIQHRKYVALIN
jgi:hypothetical protein